MIAPPRALRRAVKRILRALGRPDEPEMVRLKASAPTVTAHETAALGPLWDATPFEPRDDCPCPACRRARRRLRREVDFEQLPP